MLFRNGATVPFQFGGIKKLVVIYDIRKIKDIIRSQFKVTNFKFYNKKIGFEIPDDLFERYLAQRHDLTNFVIEIVEDINSKESSANVETLSQPLNQTNSKRKEAANFGNDTIQKKVKQQTTDNDLQEILDTLEGQQLRKSYDMLYRLSDVHQTLLAKLVVTHEMKKILMSDSPLTISNQRYISLANAIVDKFPNEVATTYCFSLLKQLLSTTTGKFIDEFNAMKCQYLKNEAETRYRQSGKNIQDDFPELYEFNEIKENALCFRTWQQTHDLRMIYLQNTEEPLKYIINCSDKRGIQLIDYDFERLHPGKKNGLLDNWDQAGERIFTEALVSSRNDVPLILDLYGSMPQLSSFMMFSYFLENYERDVQPFKKDNSRNLVIHIDTVTGDPIDIFKKYYKQPNKMNPRVFVVGTNAENLRSYVLVGYSLFSVETVLKAVDFCFKCYHVLHLSYLQEQNQAWHIIQKALYDIHSGEDEIVNVEFLNIIKGS